MTDAEMNEASGQSAEDQQRQAQIELEAAKYEAEKIEAEAEKRYAKATLKFEMNDLDEALMLIRSALSLSPGNPKYHYNLGFLYWRKGLLEVAVNHYKLFLRYAPQTDKDQQVIKDRIVYLEKEIKNRIRPRR